MRVLLTGSSGWLGRYLAPMLRQAGHAVVGLDLLPGPDTEVVGSITDGPLVEKAMREHGIDAVVHSATLHKPDLARFSSQAFVDVNVTGTLNLLQAAAATGVSRFVYTSTTSLMISERIRAELDDAAVWLDEESGPLAPRNMYGVTKLAAENLCRIHHVEQRLNCVVLRVGRFFPEEDDSQRELPGPNLKANEMLHRRLTVHDAARAHIAALEAASDLGFELFVVSAPPPFVREDARALKSDAAAVIRRCFPEAERLYAARGWRLPRSIGRVYDPSRIERVLGFRCQDDFAAVLAALSTGAPLPFVHDPGFVAPHAALAETF